MHKYFFFPFIYGHTTSFNTDRDIENEGIYEEESTNL